jgi:hypothetical protein
LEIDLDCDKCKGLNGRFLENDAVTRLETIRSIPWKLLLTAGLLTGLLTGYIYIVVTLNFSDINLVASAIFVFGCVLGLLVGWRSFGAGFVLGSFFGVVFFFGVAFNDHDATDLDQLRTWIGIGPSDQEWIQKADKKGIYLPRESVRVRFDDQSGWHGAFRYDFELESGSVSELRDQKKLMRVIPVEQYSYFCQPGAVFQSTSGAATKRYDITAFRAGNWKGGGSGIILEVLADGSGRGCVYATGIY